MSDAGFKRDGIELGSPWGLAACAGISAFAVFDDLSAAFQCTDFTDPGNVVPVPLNAEFEIFVRVEAMRVFNKLWHDKVLFKCSLRFWSLHVGLTGNLLKRDNDKFGRLQRSKADRDIDNALIDIVLRRGFAVALYEIGISRC